MKLVTFLYQSEQKLYLILIFYFYKVLEDYNKDYQKLIKLNAYIESLYKDELKKISNLKKLLKRKKLKKWIQKKSYFQMQKK